MISCATDGAPSMIGRYKGLVARIKNKVPNLFAIHCVIHRQHLCAKNISGRLSYSLNLVVRVVNKIKTRALNTRLFRQLCDENDENLKDCFCIQRYAGFQKGHVSKDFSVCMTQL